MIIRRREFLGALPLAIASCTDTSALSANPALTQRTRILVGWPEGGPMDIAARMIARALSRHMGRPFMVQNLPGESGNVATLTAAKAPADGSVLLLCGPVNAINATLLPSLHCNFPGDFAPVGSLYRVPLVIEIHPGVDARDMPEFLALARSRPGKLRVAYAGKGTPQHLGIALFEQRAGVKFDLVAYAGSVPAISDLLAAKVDAMFDPLPSSLPHIRAGRLVPLAVTAPEPSAALPGTPSANRYVPGYQAGSWFGLVAPRETPGPMIDAIARSVSESFGDEAVLAEVAEVGGTAFRLSPSAFARFLRKETAHYATVIRALRLLGQY